MRKHPVTTGVGRRGLGPRERFIIKLPLHLATQVRALAAQGRRPLNTQIEILIERALRQDTVAAA